MDEAERLSNLIAGIYDAALDPALWPVALRKASVFVNGSCSTLFAKDATSKTGAIYYDDDGIDPRYTQLDFKKYVKLDPSTSAPAMTGSMAGIRSETALSARSTMSSKTSSAVLTISIFAASTPRAAPATSPSRSARTRFTA